MSDTIDFFLRNRSRTNFIAFVQEHWYNRGGLVGTPKGSLRKFSALKARAAILATSDVHIIQMDQFTCEDLAASCLSSRFG